MTREKLAAKIRELLKADLDLSFLTVLEKEDLARLIALIRDRVDRRRDYDG